MNFDPLLVRLFEGLLENSHPYTFISRAAIKDLLSQSNAAPKTIPLLYELTGLLRVCLSSKDVEVISNGLYGLRHLSAAVGKALDPFLHLVLSLVGKSLGIKRLCDEVTETLQLLEANGVRLSG